MPLVCVIAGGGESGGGKGGGEGNVQHPRVRFLIASQEWGSMISPSLGPRSWPRPREGCGPRPLRSHRRPAVTRRAPWSSICISACILALLLQVWALPCPLPPRKLSPTLRSTLMSAEAKSSRRRRGRPIAFTRCQRVQARRQGARCRLISCPRSHFAPPSPRCCSQSDMNPPPTGIKL